MLFRYSDAYDYQDAMRDKFEDSCEDCFCMDCMEVSKCYYADDERITTCCRSNSHIMDEDIVFLVARSDVHVARKDHDDNIKKGDKYRLDYVRIVYMEGEDKYAEAYTFKNLIKKGS